MKEYLNLCAIQKHTFKAAALMLKCEMVKCYSETEVLQTTCSVTFYSFFCCTLCLSLLFKILILSDIFGNFKGKYVTSSMHLNCLDLLAVYQLCITCFPTLEML